VTLVERLAERKRQLRAMNLARPPSPATDLARALEEDQRRAGRRQALRAAGLPDADTADRIRERERDVPRPRARLLPPESDPTAAPTTSLAATDPGAPSPPPGADAEMVSAGTPGPGTDAGTPEAPIPSDLESGMTAIPMCSDCGTKPAHCRGLCACCYDRHRRQHDLDLFAAPPKNPGGPGKRPAPVVDECPQWGPDPTADAGPPTPPAPTVEELRERAPKLADDALALAEQTAEVERQVGRLYQPVDGGPDLVERLRWIVDDQFTHLRDRAQMSMDLAKAGFHHSPTTTLNHRLQDALACLQAHREAAARTPTPSPTSQTVRVPIVFEVTIRTPHTQE